MLSLCHNDKDTAAWEIVSNIYSIQVSFSGGSRYNFCLDNYYGQSI